LGRALHGAEDEQEGRAKVTGPTPHDRVIAGRYRLTGELGRGGMGVVWLAADELVGREVAVKELRAPAGLPAAEAEVIRERALQEARNAARVDHAGAVALYDVLPATAEDAAVYLIMELVRAPTLADIIWRERRLAPQRTAVIGLQLLDVVQAAHAIGVVHRDIKPGNILIAAGDKVKLTDFGIAHNFGDPRLTRSGVMGTQAYLAPEVFESAPITPAVDLWALGATLFHAVDGRGPFERETTGATLRAILFEELPVPYCPPPLSAAIDGLLRRDPGQRMTGEQARPLLEAAVTQPAAASATTGHATGRYPQARTAAALGTGSAAASTGDQPSAAGASAGAWQGQATTRSPGAARPTSQPAAAGRAGGTVTFSNRPGAFPRFLIAIGCLAGAAVFYVLLALVIVAIRHH
jgi:tRNA A-37 threonylcarbamoyl transferase component Bud32